MLELASTFALGGTPPSSDSSDRVRIDCGSPLSGIRIRPRRATTRRALRAAAVGWHQPTKFTVGSVFSESFRGGWHEETRSIARPRARACSRRPHHEGQADEGQWAHTCRSRPRQPARIAWYTLPVLLTVEEAADLLRTTRRALYAMIERHQLPGVIRIRRRVLLRGDDLLDWLDQKRAPSPEE